MVTLGSPTPAESLKSEDMEELRLYEYHLSLLDIEPQHQGLEEAITTPIFTMPVLKHAETISSEDGREPFPQYGLLAGIADDSCDAGSDSKRMVDEDPRLFFNIAAPSSIFICGSQGSGKSHTLSCLLENCLFPSDANKLPKPLSGVVFHYDTFISDQGGSPCEAAFLASNPEIKVRVLCSPTNLRTMQRTYGPLGIKVQPLKIKEADLNTKRMLDLMAVSHNDGPIPLYLHTIYRILRDMRMAQQNTGGSFSYAEFKRLVKDTPMTPAQLAPLTQRLDTLESFMIKAETGIFTKQKRTTPDISGTDWTNKAGCLTIVDLSCPCVTPESACSLFNICLSIFLEHKTATGRVIALDEAHKYMNASAEADTLTSTLLTTVRLQRHLGARIIISTQEPTISPSLLDLSSVTIVHRFTSPDWLRSLKEHLAAAASDLIDQKPQVKNVEEVSHGHPNKNSKETTSQRIFGDIVMLRVGEALLFSPNAIVGLEKGPEGTTVTERLGKGYLKIRVRKRLTTDGGKSDMAV